MQITKNHTEILIVAKDIIYISSYGQKDTPKRVRLVVSLRHLTGSNLQYNYWIIMDIFVGMTKCLELTQA